MPLWRIITANCAMLFWQNLPQRLDIIKLSQLHMFTTNPDHRVIWVSSSDPVTMLLGIHSELNDEFTRKRKQKHELDNAGKALLKYKKRRLIIKYGHQAVNFPPGFS